MPDDVLDRLRRLCLALPEATERLSHGGPLGFWCAAPPGAQQALIAAAPERFFRPPYAGHRGWLGVNLEGEVDWDEIEEIIADAYRCIAPKRLIAALDAGAE